MTRRVLAFAIDYMLAAIVFFVVMAGLLIPLAMATHGQPLVWTGLAIAVAGTVSFWWWLLSGRKRPPSVGRKLLGIAPRR